MRSHFVVATALLVSSFTASRLAAAKPVAVNVSKDGPHHAKIAVPDGTFCGVDGALLKRVDGAIGLYTTRQHTVTCGPSANRRAANDTTIPPDFLGKMKVSATFAPAKDGKGRVTATLVDQSGAPVDDVTVVAKSPDGATLGAVTPAQNGQYAFDASPPAGKKTFKVHVEVAGAEPIEDVELRSDGKPNESAPPPATPPPSIGSPAPAPASTQQPDTSQPTKPSHPRVVQIEFGVMGGLGIGSAQKGAGPNAAVELGVSHAWKKIALAAMVRGGFEKYPAAARDEQILSLALPLTLRILPNNVAFPYLSVVPSLVFDGVVFEGLPGGGRDTVTAPSIGGLGGAQVKAGPVGFFGEAGVRFGRINHGANSKFDVPIFQGAIGARIAF